MKILVTGSAGQFAKVLIPKLLELNEVDEIIGIDTRVSDLEHPRLHNHLVDVRSKKLVDYLYNIDIAIHLAFVVLRQNLKGKRFKRSLIYDMNVNGSINFFTSAALQGVKNIIYLSSASVYGAWPTNPFMIKEDYHRRPIHGFSYAEDKVAVENWLDRFEQQQNSLRIVRLRPQLIVGPNAHPFVKKFLSHAFYPYFHKPPLTQCVWEEDVADAIIKSMFSKCAGSFNLSASPPLSYRRILAIARTLPMPMPYSVLKAVQKTMWYINGSLGEPGMLAGMRHSLTIDSSRAGEQLGWQPSRSTEDCLRDMFSKYEQIL